MESEDLSTVPARSTPNRVPAIGTTPPENLTPFERLYELSMILAHALVQTRVTAWQQMHSASINPEHRQAEPLDLRPPSERECWDLIQENPHER